MSKSSSSRTLAIAACAVATTAFAPRAVAQAPTAAAPASAKRSVTVDDLLAMRVVSAPAISPDGRWVAYVVTRSDPEKNVNQSSIWLVGTSGGTPVALTRGPRADRAPRWAPDGRWLAFLSDRDTSKRTQVYGISPGGGEAWAITTGETSVTDFRISPDGRRIAFIATAKASKADEQLEKERGRPMVRDSAYAAEWSHLWVGTLTSSAATEVRRSSPELLDVTSAEWAPDSRRLAWSAKPSPILRYNPMSAVYVQEEVGATPRKVSDMPGAESVAGWDNALGLLVSATAQAVGTNNRQLWVIADEGAPRSLTGGLDEDAQFVAATPNALYVEAARRTGRGLYRIPLANGQPAGAPVKVSDDARFATGFSATPSADIVAFLGETGTAPADVYTSPTLRFAARRLTEVNPEAANFALGEQRVVRWKSSADGEEIEGILSLPVGYVAGVRVPLLLVIHGGPTGVSADRFPPVRGAYPVAVFNALGYAVLQPNYRGSAGYGQRFRGLNRGDISGRDWIDVNSGVDYLIAQSIADSSKLGIMGWSFGGHHTFWGITQTPRFKAASAGAGATDLISMYSQTDLPEFYQTYLGPRPWEDFKLYESRSAYRLVDRVVTPLLIQVGEADRRVPAEQSIQFYEAMKAIGKAPVKLVMYPGQPHGIQDPRLQRDLMRRNVEWFTQWIPTARARERADR